MAKVGDTVRFLNSIGGGKITRIVDKMAYVEEDGFETPVLLKEIVVVMPAGHEPSVKGAKLMFDQAAFDKGREEAPAAVSPQSARPVAIPSSESELPVEETAHGDRMNISIAFEPADTRRLSSTTFNAVLVNDSNYFLSFAFLRRGADDRGWSLVYQSTVAPNELIDLASYTHDTLGDIERIALQFVAFKKSGAFEMKPPVSVSRRLDLTKFHKLHCFRPGIYFDSPVLEYPMVSNDTPVKSLAETPAEPKTASETDATRELAKKFRVDSGRKGKKSQPADNPHKLLPLQEIDLHISELTDTIAGMQPADMLEMQLDTVRKTMKAHEKRIGQKIVFIHGKGDGVLRKAVIDLIKKGYPKAELQDASFREYGFGATLVTIH